MGTLPIKTVNIGDVGSAIEVGTDDWDDFVNHEFATINPSQITSNQNNYSPTGLTTTTKSILRLDADSSLRFITGLAGGVAERKIRLRNISNNTIMLADQTTTLGGNSSSANRFDFNGYDIALLPKMEIGLRYDSSLTKWVLSNNGFIIPRTGLGFHSTNDCFITGSQNAYATTAASGGTVSNSAVSSVAAHPGLFQFTLGTSATGSLSYKTSPSNPYLLGNSWYWRCDHIIKVDKLSDATDTYTLRVGFIDSGTAESTDAVMFRYTHSVNSGNWVLVTRSNSTETTSNTSTAVSTASYVHLTCIVTSSSNADFFINGTKVGNITTNIPTGASRGTGSGMMLLKTAGTTDSAVITIDQYEVIAYANTLR